MKLNAGEGQSYRSPSTGGTVRAVLFDTFGTVVDWRSGVAQAVGQFSGRLGLGLDATAFAEEWRGEYYPSMASVKSGERPYVPLSQLHLENLERVLGRHGLRVDDFERSQIEDLNKAWERLPAWPDSVVGLTRLKQHFIISPLSNGDVSILVNMAKFAGLPWDLVIGSTLTHAYKPTPAAYHGAAEILQLPPREIMMVAAHNYDLQGARDAGMATGFVARPHEFGPGQTSDLEAESDWDVVAADFVDLASQLCSSDESDQSLSDSRSNHSGSNS